MTKGQLIDKPLSYRLGELLQSLLVVRDSVFAIQHGRWHHLLPLAGQLRALLTEKARPSRPLLIDVAEQFGIPLELYAVPGVKQSSTEDLLLVMEGFLATTHHALAEQQSISLEDYLSRPVVRYDGGDYSAEEVLAFVANQAGGAHFAPRWPKALSELLLSRWMGQSPLANMLVQMGVATQQLGAQLLQELANIEAEILVIVPPQDLATNGYFWDARYTGDSGRLYCFLDPMKRVHFGITGMYGGDARVISQRVIDWTVPHVLSFGVLVNDDLTTTLRLCVDGEVSAEARSESLLFLHAAREHYTVYLNGTGEAESLGLSVGIGTIEIHQADHSAIERASRLFVNQEQRGDLARLYLTFDAEQRGVIAPFAAMPAVSDGVVECRADELLARYKTSG